MEHTKLHKISNDLTRKYEHIVDRHQRIGKPLPRLVNPKVELGTLWDEGQPEAGAVEVLSLEPGLAYADQLWMVLKAHVKCFGNAWDTIRQIHQNWPRCGFYCQLLDRWLQF